MNRVGFFLEALNEKGELELQRLYDEMQKEAEKGDWSIDKKNPFTLKVQIRDVRVRAAASMKRFSDDVVAGFVFGAERQMLKYAPLIKRGEDYKIISFNEGKHGRR
jgi:hypothetical protein